MSGERLAGRIVAALDAHKGVLLPAVQALMEEAWAEGWQHYKEHFSPNFPEYGLNPYVAVPPRVLTFDERMDFERRWDARVEAGRK